MSKKFSKEVFTVTCQDSYFSQLSTYADDLYSYIVSLFSPLFQESNKPQLYFVIKLTS